MNRIFYLYIFLIFTKSICAQHTMGLVFGIDDKAKKEALPGANVYWLGTTIGSLTNQTGQHISGIKMHLKKDKLFGPHIVTDHLKR